MNRFFCYHCHTMKRMEIVSLKSCTRISWSALIGYMRCKCKLFHVTSHYHHLYYLALKCSNMCFVRAVFFAHFCFFFFFKQNSLQCTSYINILLKEYFTVIYRHETRTFLSNNQQNVTFRATFFFTFSTILKQQQQQ